jgi:hypothetical protein
MQLVSLHPGGVVAPRNNGGDPYDPSNAPSGQETMNLGNKYAKSYSSSNPPPRPGGGLYKLESSCDTPSLKPPGLVSTLEPVR